ncbi:peptidase S8 [Shewanella sp. OPT22]|nr:peptidase S8 [Shewanella sp. OPT22]
MKNKTRQNVALGLSAIAMAVATVANANSVNPLNNGFSQESPLPKRYIIKFRDAESASFLANDSFVTNSVSASPRSFERSNHMKAMSSVQARQMKQIGRSRSYTAELNDSALLKLRSRVDVEFVEEDSPRRLLSETTPWGQTYVGATSLDDSQTGNRTVCIIDSGYDIDHNDLSGNQVTGTNNSGTGNWYDPGSNNAHGTHVAGTIAAINNSEGVVGVMPNQNANVHVIKVFNSSGWGYSSDLVSAIDRCVDAGANVVNMSLGGAGSNNTERNALQAHANNGVLLVAAAGNDGNSDHSYPASYDAVMSVGAVDSNKQHAEFSQFTNQVEISGPGEAILSTVSVGEGRLADITINGQSYFDDGIVPHSRLVPQGTSFGPSPINGSFSGELSECSVSGSNYSCGNMFNKVCLVERVGNQGGGSYPDYDAVEACENAGARATIVFSNTERPGLQNPFDVDRDTAQQHISVSVDRATGLALRNQLGQTAAVNVTAGEDYEYYNGTSMATPHVAGVATLVWSYHPQCTGAQVRAALTATAEDIDVAGRDNRTGFGLVDAVAAKEYLDASCNGPTDPGTGGSELENGVAKMNLEASAGDELHYTLEVPAGATDLGIVMSGGNGDADLYVKYGSAPTTNDYDCRPWKNGNNESCPVSNSDVQSGTYYVMVRAYSTFSGVKLQADFTESSTTPPGGAASYTNNGNYSIPDNSAAGVSSPINVTRTGDSGSVTVAVDISHTYIGDLEVRLVSPTGAFAVLHANDGGGSNDITQTYTADFSGVESSGTWTLKAVDNARRDIGTINSWTLNFQ